MGNVVISTAGRDKGSYFVVINTEGDYVYLADGDMRKIERPKKKKIKHIELTSFFAESIVRKITKKSKITNLDLRKALKTIQK